jgi:hypothetical protein
VGCLTTQSHWSDDQEKTDAAARTDSQGQSGGFGACGKYDWMYGGRREELGRYERPRFNMKLRSEGSACEQFFSPTATGYGGMYAGKCDEYCGYCTPEEECVDNDAGLQERTRESPETDGQGYTCSEYLSRGYHSPRNSESRKRCGEISKIESGLCCASCGE